MEKVCYLEFSCKICCHYILRIAHCSPSNRVIQNCGIYSELILSLFFGLERKDVTIKHAVLKYFFFHYIIQTIDLILYGKNAVSI